MNLRYLIASTVQTQIELESMRQDFMTYGKLKINRKTFSMKIVCWGLLLWYFSRYFICFSLKEQKNGL